VAFSFTLTYDVRGGVSTASEHMQQDNRRRAIMRLGGQIVITRIGTDNVVERSETEMKRELWNQGLMYFLVGLFVFLVAPVLYRLT
jgi:hypothetical protein